MNVNRNPNARPEHRSAGSNGGPHTSTDHGASAYASTVAGSHARGLDDDRNSVGTLLRQLTRDVPELVVKELALARAELTESMRATKAGLASMVGGGAVLLAGLVVLLMSAVYALSNVVEPWLAALLVGGLVVVVGMVMVSAGKKKLEPASFTPDRTLNQLHKDKDTLTGRTA